MATTIQHDAPHPDSYRPDLPLRSELKTASAMEARYDEGFEDGMDYARRKARGKEADLQVRLDEAAARIITLEAQVTSLTTPRAAEG